MAVIEMPEAGSPQRIRSPFGQISVSEGMLLLILFAVSSGLPLAIWNRAVAVTSDSLEFMSLARSLVDGSGYVGLSGVNTFHVPLYPLLIAGAHLFIADVATSARVVSLIASALAVIFFYGLLRTQYSRYLSLSAALLFAVLPLRVWSGQWALAEGLYLMLVMAAVWSYFAAPFPIMLCSIWAGGLIGLAYLTRPEALLYLAVLMLFQVLSFRKLSLRSSLQNVFILAVAFSITVGPYYFWKHQVAEGTPFSDGRLQNALFQSDLFMHDENPNSTTHQSIVRPNSTEFLPLQIDLSAPAIACRYLFHANIEIKRFTYLLGPRGISLPLLLLGLLWMIWLVRREGSSDVAWQLLLFSPLLAFPIFHIEDRYLLPVLPVGCLWLAKGPAWLGQKLLSFTVSPQWVRNKPAFLNARRFPPLLVNNQYRLPQLLTGCVVFVLLGAYSNRLVTQLPPSPQPSPNRLLGEQAYQNRIPTRLILAQDRVVPYYAEMQHLWTPGGAATDVLNYACLHGAQYIVISSEDVPSDLNRRIDEGEKFEDLHLLIQTESDNGHASLYQLDCPKN